MRPAATITTVVAALALGTGQALPDRVRGVFSSSPAFSIDERRFLVEEAAGTRAAVEQELARRGIDASRLSDHLASVPAFRTVEPLREEPSPAPARPYPRGLAPERVLRLETADGPVEIAFGHLDRKNRKDVLERLRSRGWNCTETGRAAGLVAIARLTERKESALVLLAEDEGRFLAIRRAAR